MTTIDILALSKAGPAALGLVIDALDTANRIAHHVGAERLDWRVMTTGGSGVSLRHGIAVPAQSISGVRASEAVVALGIGAAGPEEIEQRLLEPDAREAVHWLRAAHRRSVTLAAACTGVFLLGDAGALDGRLCTTTWWLSGVLARRCPTARVNADAIVLEDQGVWTAGAMISHLDLMIALIERFAGAALAKETARRLAAPMRVSQAPYMSASDLAHGSEELAAFESFIANNISGAIVVEDAARAQDVGTHAVTPGPRRHRAVDAAVHSKNSAE